MSKLKNKAKIITPAEDREESIFRAAMQRMAAVEGQHAIEENERLKNDPNFVVPKSLHQKCMKILEEQYEV